MAERSQKRKAEMSLSDEERMAVVSHYLHNRGYASEKVYEDKALPLLRDFYAEDSFQGRADGILAERSVQASLFPQFFSVPFPETRCPEFTFIVLFAGIGGFRIALQNQGGRCVYSSEWDVQAQKTYLANFGEMPFGDITCASTKAFIPDRFDVLCAGFPCQPFSISGRQKGFEDTRGTLFFDICQILDEKRPPVVFLENVKHLMYHDGGKTLNTILEKLSGLGYKVSWRILNGADYGVPQNRERIIIIGSRDKLFDFGSLRAMPRRPLKDFLDKSGDFEYLDPSEYTLLEQMHQQPRLMLLIKQRENSKIELAKPHSLSISDIIQVLELHFNYRYSCQGASRLPVLAIYAAYQCMVREIFRFRDKVLCPLEAHTSADSQSGQIGDIQVNHGDGSAFEGVEVKHQIPIDVETVRHAYSKFMVYRTDRYYLLTTADMDAADWESINREIRQIRRNHGCQVIVNGVYSSLRYYLRMLDDTALFIEYYVSLLERDKSIKYPHLVAWNEIISKTVF